MNSNNTTSFINIALFMLALMFSAQIFATNNKLPVKDIRVVIDMSGSMKKNDPSNHRTKAVRLFSEVLPDDVLSGIWTFASEVNMLIKHGKVNKAWKKSAFKKAAGIHSYGLYTNIEKALKKSTDDWYKPDPLKEKHLILLTDGYIDISKDKSKNKQSRENIINKIIPSFRKNKVHVHSIALSDDADHNLLKTLSAKTGGSYVVIKNAGDLDRYFFKLFQATSKPDTIPFKRNKFEVDKSINDLTIVLFNSDNPTKLSTPDKKSWSHKNHPDNVKWVKSDNYEIITISGPTTGSWEVDAPIDPDNKIMIVTNLRLQVGKLPVLLLPGDPMTIKAAIFENGKIITRKDFIKILNIKSIVRQSDSISRSILDTQYSGKGVFSAIVGTNKYKNNNTLTVIVKSPTFTRQYQHDFNVVTEPVLIESKIKNKKIILNTLIDDRIIDKSKFNIKISNHDEKHPFNKVTANWVVSLPASFSGQVIKVIINAFSQNNKPFNQIITLQLPAIKKPEISKNNPINHKTDQAPHKADKTEQAHHKTESHEPEKIKNESEKENVVIEEITTEDNTSISWIIVFVLVLVVNIILITGGYFLYKKFIKSVNDSPSLDADEEDSINENNKDDESKIEGLEEIEDLDVNGDEENKES